MPLESTRRNTLRDKPLTGNSKRKSAASDKKRRKSSKRRPKGPSERRSEPRNAKKRRLEKKRERSGRKNGVDPEPESVEADRIAAIAVAAAAAAVEVIAADPFPRDLRILPIHPTAVAHRGLLRTAVVPRGHPPIAAAPPILLHLSDQTRSAAQRKISIKGRAEAKPKSEMPAKVVLQAEAQNLTKRRQEAKPRDELPVRVVLEAEAQNPTKREMVENEKSKPVEPEAQVRKRKQGESQAARAMRRVRRSPARNLPKPKRMTTKSHPTKNHDERNVHAEILRRYHRLVLDLPVPEAVAAEAARGVPPCLRAVAPRHRAAAGVRVPFREADLRLVRANTACSMLQNPEEWIV